MAMLTVALVASLSATVLWQQWQVVEVERAERARAQAAWLFTGALDWARVVLREDARTEGVDHLLESWAVVRQESRLSGFLAAGNPIPAGADAGSQLEAVLSADIEDMQSRLNVMNLLDASDISAPDVLAFTRLFTVLDLPVAELLTLTQNLQAAASDRTDAAAATTGPRRLMPQRVEQLRGLGLSQTTLVRLQPHVSLLPARTAVNLNTARAEVMHASAPGLALAQARQLVVARAVQPFTNLEDVMRLTTGTPAQVSEGRHSVGSRFFEVHVRLRLTDLPLQERSLLQRDGLEVKTLWREPMPLSPEGATR